MKKLTFSPEQNSLAAFGNASDHVDVKTLSAGVAQTFNKPNGARFVRLSGTAAFAFKPDATASLDASVGVASAIAPAMAQPMFCVDDIGVISVIAPTPCAVSAEWWA